MRLFRRKDETDTWPQAVLQIDGMHCASCGLAIDDELEDVAGVHSATTDVRTGRAVVRLESADVDMTALIAAVQRAGAYQARPAD